MTSLLCSSLHVDDLAGGVFYGNETVDLYDKVQGIMKEGDSHCTGVILTDSHFANE